MAVGVVTAVPVIIPEECRSLRMGAMPSRLHLPQSPEEGA